MSFNILGSDGIDENILKIRSESIQGVDSSAINQSRISQEESLGGVDGPYSQVIKVLGTDSLFNPFSVFRYSDFAEGSNATTAGKYNFSKHRNTYINSDILAASAQEAAARSELNKRSVIQNPTAINIIEWTQSEAEKGESHTGPLYPYPYQVNDFLWCKWYGKIPNNRLLTLRRYPIPIEDNLAIDGSKLPLVPIAQAVTWWGGETDNSLSKILGMTYGFKWKQENSEITDITGNEISAEAILDAAGIEKNATNAPLRQAMLLLLNSNDSPFAFSGYDKTLQDFTKESWKTGAYWNRVLGPVNVIDSTQIRQRGYDFTHDITLNFEYNLRSYGTLNPKIAILDLISNFMSLTYNRANFWGGGYRYFQQTGALFPEFNTGAMERGEYVDAIKDIGETLGQLANAKAAELKSLIDRIGPQFVGKDANQITSILSSELGQSPLVNNIISTRLKDLHQKPLVLRSLLDGRAVGEWHLMVGNPMDPLAVIGNLCLKSTSITFSDELGADDFPTSIKFTVTLTPGRPRAKQDIESMFNHGGGDLSHTALAPPSSTANSYGEYNSKRLANAYGSDGAVKDFSESLKQSQASTDSTQAAAKANYFRVNVANKYGVGFGQSPILTDYFTNLQTKD
jgi:hypothetical protein